jgi:2,4'-dihydroxyacetophenone dioxygenase
MSFVETLDGWWFIHHCESYCREHGIPMNKQLYI